MFNQLIVTMFLNWFLPKRLVKSESENSKMILPKLVIAISVDGIVCKLPDFVHKRIAKSEFKNTEMGLSFLRPFPQS